MSSLPSTVQRIDTDILIIGSGGSGLRAAIAASEKGAKVLIIAKELLKDAHTGWAMGGLNVALKAPATPQLHFEDTIKGGWFINNYKLARIFAEEMPDRIYDLERYGVKFDRLPDGSYFTWAGGKQSAPLNLCAGDYTGREMMQGLLAEVAMLDVPYLEYHYVTKLLRQGDKVVGAFLIDRKTGTYRVVQAKATIVATGGGGNMYKINTNAPSNTGEGYAWALDVGAELVDMEMIQFHPTGMAYPPEKRGTLVTEKVRGNGGILKNELGERFMQRYQPERLELALDGVSLRLGRGFDLRLERLLVRVDALLGPLLRGLGVGLELLDLLLDLGQHGPRHLARHEVALLDDDLLVAVLADGHLAP